VVMSVEVARKENDCNGDIKKEAEIPTLPKPKFEREVERLNLQLDEVVQMRETVKKELEIVMWRHRLLELAIARAESRSDCGWDQRLCFGDEEWTDFGMGVLETYEENGQKNDTMSVDDDGEWWCAGKKKCDRHAGWQVLRTKDITYEIERIEELLANLTREERETRKRIEDIADRGGGGTGKISPNSPASPLKFKTSNNHAMMAHRGEEKKGKKKSSH